MQHVFISKAKLILNTKVLKHTWPVRTLFAIRFENIGVLDSYFIHRYTITSIMRKIVPIQKLLPLTHIDKL